MHEVGTDVARNPIKWERRPVEAGASSTGKPGLRISGRFYGDTHQEVGGIFTRHTTAGVLGAKREPYQGG